ncbi:hypothetical protein MTO96_009728 [Rhipicephalus appendiculatus]
MRYQPLRRLAFTLKDLSTVGSVRGGSGRISCPVQSLADRQDKFSLSIRSVAARAVKEQQRFPRAAKRQWTGINRVVPASSVCSGHGVPPACSVVSTSNGASPPSPLQARPAQRRPTAPRRPRTSDRSPRLRAAFRRAAPICWWRRASGDSPTMLRIARCSANGPRSPASACVRRTMRAPFEHVFTFQTVAFGPRVGDQCLCYGSVHAMRWAFEEFIRSSRSEFSFFSFH